MQSEERFCVGDYVLLSTEDIEHAAGASAPTIVPFKIVGPFRVAEMVSDAVCRVSVPKSMGIDGVFELSKLILFEKGKEQDVQKSVKAKKKKTLLIGPEPKIIDEQGEEIGLQTTLVEQPSPKIRHKNKIKVHVSTDEQRKDRIESQISAEELHKQRIQQHKTEKQQKKRIQRQVSEDQQDSQRIETHKQRIESQIPAKQQQKQRIESQSSAEQQQEETIEGHNSEEPPTLVVVDGEVEYEVEEILDDRAVEIGDNGRPRMEYLVKWKGYPISEATWEPRSNLTHAKRLLKRFIRTKKRKGRGNILGDRSR